MPQVRSSVPLAIALCCALWAVTPQARAADQGITGKKLLLKGTKFVLLSKDPSISIIGSDPVAGSDSSMTFDDCEWPGCGTVSFFSLFS